MKLFLLLSVIFISGCGTVSTVYKSDQYAIGELKKAKTLCHELPRVYSGVSFDLCQINSHSENPFRYMAYSLYLFDTLPSAVVDTVILPYTIYKQKEKVGIRVSN